MSEFNVRIDDRELASYVRTFTALDRRVASLSSRWIRKLAKRTEASMKLYSKPHSARGTGRLSSSITTEYELSKNNLGATIYVPSSVHYQYAAEYGFKRKFVIKGKPRMTFSAEAWSQATSAPNRGYFIFTKVVRGRYRGMRFTQKAFGVTTRMYERNKERILDEIGNVILFSRS
jgi:hypothetical protein